jgi:ABC-type sugar transport system ATPase subunit
MQGISKAFPGVQALTDVSLEVCEGEIHGLVGKNGAGKSTLMAVLMGLQRPDAGSLEIDGHIFTTWSPHEALTAGVAYVPQHVTMMDSLTVAENILAGEMPINRFGVIDWNKVFAESEKRLNMLGLNLDVRERVEGLGVVEQTMMAIAKALFSQAKLIILDEPTAALPRADIDRLFNFVRSLKKTGVAFIYISHHLEEVFEICDRVTILRNGFLVATRDVSSLDAAELIRLMVGENIKEYSRVTARQPEDVLVIQGLTRRGHYEDVNLVVQKGEVVGISGLEGSGAPSLGKALFGLEPMGIGSILVKGKPFVPSSPRHSLDQGLAYLPQDRYRYGLVSLRPVRENITYTILDRLAMLFGFINAPQERSLVQQYIDQLGVICPSQEQRVGLLSGGNQQKVVFAKLAATKPAVLVLHEPTQGIDVRAKLDIYRIVDELSAQGIAIVIISTEVRELLGVCDRILVMYEGKITREFKIGDPETTPDNILLAIEGGNNHGQR